MSFSNLSKQAPSSGKTVPYTLRTLRNPDGTHPVFHVEYLGESNRPYWLELLARSSAKARAVNQSGVSPGDIDKANRETRDENRLDVANHSVRRLENLFHDDGAPATDKDIRNAVLALPDVDFDRLYGYVSGDIHFRDYPITTAPAALAEK